MQLATFATKDFRKIDCLEERLVRLFVSPGIDQPAFVITPHLKKFREHYSCDLGLIQRQFLLLFLQLIKKLFLIKRFFEIYQDFLR